MFRKKGLNRMRGLKDWLGLILIVVGGATLAIVMPGWFWFFILGVGLIVGGLFMGSR